MKKDIDDLMRANGIDAILVIGSGRHNPAMVYLTGGAQLPDALLVKKRGDSPVLFYNPMERDEAAKTGLPTRNLNDYRLDLLRKQKGDDLLKAVVERYRLILNDLGITSGRLLVYGKSDAGEVYALLSAMQDSLPDITLAKEYGDSLLFGAMATKDIDEVERIRAMGQVTIEVVAQTVDYLTSHQVKEKYLMRPDGTPLTIGEVKQRINLWLAERRVENIAGMIFAIGRDAGIPHSSGVDNDRLRTGETIIFDIFPCEAGGGYFYDFTRTWCLGFATDETLALYEDVLMVYQHTMSSLRAGCLCRDYQKLACDLFESRGHETIQNNPQVEEGYVHGLGHGIGLHVHERPYFRINGSQEDRLDPGVVVTIEPGLYYPSRGIGIRLEDTIWVQPDGRIDVLAEFPLDLVLPMKKT